MAGGWCEIYVPCRSWKTNTNLLAPGTRVASRNYIMQEGQESVKAQSIEQLARGLYLYSLRGVARERVCQSRALTQIGSRRLATPTGHSNTRLSYLYQAGRERRCNLSQRDRELANLLCFGTGERLRGGEEMPMSTQATCPCSPASAFMQITGANTIQERRISLSSNPHEHGPQQSTRLA